jgi:hypothetical protein
LRKGYRPVEIPVNYTARSFASGKKITFFRDPITWILADIKYLFADPFDKSIVMPKKAPTARE